MHSFLIVGGNLKSIEKAIEKLVRENVSAKLEYEVKKIEDTRNLAGLTRLKTKKTLAIILKDFEQATLEAQSAFLKNLEEPRENLIYILTADSVHKLLPTIISRCQIIKLAVKVSEPKNKKLANDFMNMQLGAKFNQINTMKSRENALEFVENFIMGLHLLLSSTSERLLLTKNIKSANKTRLALLANGNVNLQLSNLAINTK